MAVTVPTIWDYLGGGIDRGMQSYQDTRSRIKGEKEKEDEKRRQNLQMVAMLFGQGAVDADEVTRAAAGAGMPDLNVQANQPQLRREVLNRPAQPLTPSVTQEAFGQVPGYKEPAGRPGGIAGASDEELLAAGLPSRSALLTEQVKAKQARGEQLTPQEAQLVGAKTEIQQILEQETSLEPIITNAASQHVDNKITTAFGGRITSANMRQVGEAAFNDWAGQFRQSRMGALTPEVEQQARAAFGAAVLRRLVEQKEQDIRSQAAAGQADYRRMSQNDKTFTMLTQAGEAKRRQIDDIMTANNMSPIMLEQFAASPNAPPAIRKAVERIQALETQLNDIESARAEVAVGTMPPRVAEILRGANQSTGTAGAGGGGDAGDETVTRIVRTIRERRISQVDAEKSQAYRGLNSTQQQALKSAMGW